MVVVAVVGYRFVFFKGVKSFKLGLLVCFVLLDELMIYDDLQKVIRY